MQNVRRNKKNGKCQIQVLKPRNEVHILLLALSQTHRGGSLVGLCFALRFPDACTAVTALYEWVQCHVHTHLPACRERALFMTHWHFDPLQFHSSNCLFSSPLLTLCHNRLRLPTLLCQHAPSASGCSLHLTFTREMKVTHVALLGNCKTNIWRTTCKKKSH